MPLLEVTDESAVQRCAVCGASRAVSLASLETGASGLAAVPLTPEVIRLPACATCGGMEFLVRSPPGDPPHPSPGSFGHLHRLLVDHLHAELVKAGRVAPGLTAAQHEAIQGAARPEAEQELRRWFPERLSLTRSLASLPISDLPAPLKEPSR